MRHSGTSQQARVSPKRSADHAVLPITLLPHRNVGRDLVLDESPRELAGPVGCIGGETLRRQGEAGLGAIYRILSTHSHP